MDKKIVRKKSDIGNNDKMFIDYPDVMCVKDVMSALKIGRHKVYDLILRGDLPSFRIGNIYKITKNALIKYINHVS